MEIWVKELEKINKTFEPSSKIKNPGSLEFAAEHATREKDWMKKLAYLLRAIVVDHAFEDGNKRTAAYLITLFFDENKVTYDEDKVKTLIVKIASENITDISKIKRLIHDETL
jgi:prophage maintenance system killer protein